MQKSTQTSLVLLEICVNKSMYTYLSIESNRLNQENISDMLQTYYLQTLL